MSFVPIYKDKTYIVRVYVGFTSYIISGIVKSIRVDDVPNNILIIDTNNKFSVYVNKKDIIKQIEL